MSDLATLANCPICGEPPVDLLPDLGSGYAQRFTDHSLFCVDSEDIILDPYTGLGQWFVNVYEVERAYGGPEEGGWWFDTGKRIASFMAPSFTDADIMRDELYSGDLPHIIEWHDEGHHWGGTEYRIDITRGNAGPAYFPDEAPHYE